MGRVVATWRLAPRDPSTTARGRGTTHLMMGRRAILAVLTVVALTVPAGVGAQQQGDATTTTSAQAFFRDLMLGDSATSAAIKRVLRTGAGFVSPQPQFADLTGDGKSDAVVTVSDGGAAGA